MSISLNDFTCPHCAKENATLFGVAKFNRPISQGISIVFSCRSCDHSMIIDVDNNPAPLILHWFQGGLPATIKIIGNKVQLQVMQGFPEEIGACEYYPVLQEVDTPKYIPESVAKSFKEAKQLLKQKMYNPSAMSTRRAIDLATKQLIPESKKMLNDRIKELKELNKIPESLSEWCHTVRLGGNSANHDDDDFTEEQAKQLLDFAEMFLLYAFTYPKMLELKKNSDQSS